MPKQNYFVVKARFTGVVPEHLESLVKGGNEVFLGRRGHWCAVEKALRFKTRNAAETAVMEKWERLRREGMKSVILTVATLSARTAV